MKGYVQVYTGNGKGKTTAALGLALRAAGAGLRVYIGQFLKGARYSEIKAMDRYESSIKVEQFVRDWKVGQEITGVEIALAGDAFKRVREVILSGQFDLVVLDEINVALHLKLISEEDVISLVKSKPPQVELVLTGRSAPDRLIDQADLVTEMREIKHYFARGVRARRGIEH